MPREVRLTQQEYNALRKKGWSHNEIAEMHDMTKAGATYAKYNGPDVYKTYREDAMEHFPWPDMPTKFRRVPPYVRTTDHMVYMNGGANELTEERMSRLQKWQRMLREQNLILEFNPEHPPQEGINAGGWMYLTRTADDENLVVRVRTEDLTSELRRLLILPQE